MRKAFTLVELLIVVAVIAVLMTIAFRLGTVATADSNRTITVVRLQKIENCLSGYYAAFGSYPPVKGIGYSEINHKVDANGDQEETLVSGKLSQMSDSVLAACRYQPFGCEYPPNDEEKDEIERFSSMLQDYYESSAAYKKSSYAAVYQAGFTGPDVKSSLFAKGKTESDWRKIKLFKFGVMSFLLPRYLFMMSMESSDWNVLQNYAQWTDNNDLPCDPFEGTTFTSWTELRDYANDDSATRSDIARIANIPSQAVCARWMPNLEGSCHAITEKTFFGVAVYDPNHTGLSADEEYPPNPHTHYPPGQTGDSGTPYMLATITMKDGWNNEFFYHSPPPYQSYVVWSSGADGKTFPPWIPIDSLQGDDLTTALGWIADDVTKMSH